jgi:hypothetical protein
MIAVHDPICVDLHAYAPAGATHFELERSCDPVFNFEWIGLDVASN